MLLWVVGHKTKTNMMNKSCKRAWLAAMFIMALVSSLPMTSCSDSKDDEPKNGDSVVGVWRSEFSAGYQLLTLEKSGKYSLIEYDSESGNWSEHGTYTVKNNVMTMIASDGEIEVLSILTITPKKMILRYEGEYVGQYPDGEIETWTREE